jgi:hypothetical protein
MYAFARLLPKEILHSRIADPVWRAFMRGEVFLDAGGSSI